MECSPGISRSRAEFSWPTLWLITQHKDDATVLVNKDGDGDLCSDLVRHSATPFQLMSNDVNNYTEDLAGVFVYDDFDERIRCLSSQRGCENNFK